MITRSVAAQNSLQSLVLLLELHIINHSRRGVRVAARVQVGAGVSCRAFLGFWTLSLPTTRDGDVDGNVGVVVITRIASPLRSD